MLLAGGIASPFAGAGAQGATSSPVSMDDEQPYGSLTIGASAARPLSDGALDRYWASGAGVRVNVSTRFHRGDIGAFAVTMPYTARADSQPDFRAYLIGVDWRMSAPARWRVRPSIGVDVGAMLSTFDGIEVKGLSKESEIFIGATAGLALRVFGRTWMTATGTGVQVLTSTPIRTSSLSLGVAQTFATPAWLRAVIE